MLWKTSIVVLLHIFLRKFYGLILSMGGISQIKLVQPIIKKYQTHSVAMILLLHPIYIYFEKFGPHFSSLLNK